MTSGELIEFRQAVVSEVIELVDELSDRMMDLLVEYQHGNMVGIDAELMGEILLNHMMYNLSENFMDNVYDLSMELDNDKSDENEEDEATSDDIDDDDEDVEDYGDKLGTTEV